MDSDINDSIISFTIVTCTYNAGDVLQRTLDSVARQTYDNVQHVIIDGASTDETMELVRMYESENRRHGILVVSEKDNGLYDAMNKALRYATGEYMVYLNAGDMLHSVETLQMMAEKIGEGRYGVVYGDTDIVDDNGHFLSPRRLRPPKTLTWRSFSDGMLVCHQAFYANTEIARRTPYNLKYRFSADVDWCIRVMKETENVGLGMLDTGMVLCDFLDGGMTTKNHRASLIERFKVMTEHYGLVKTVCKHVTFLFRK